MKHGTVDGYTNHRCRCADCRRAQTDYNRQRRAARRSPHSWHRRPVRSDELAVLCWCQLEIVSVPRTEVLACRTASCGMPNCKAPAACQVSDNGKDR